MIYTKIYLHHNYYVKNWRMKNVGDKLKTEPRQIRFTKEGWERIQKSPFSTSKIVEKIVMAFLDQYNRKIVYDQIALETLNKLLNGDQNQPFKLERNENNLFSLDVRGNRFNQLTEENVKALLQCFGCFN